MNRPINRVEFVRKYLEGDFASPIAASAKLRDFFNMSGYSTRRADVHLRRLDPTDLAMMWAR